MEKIDKVSVGGGLVALGIIFGDIGTSPLYVLKAIIGSNIISRSLVLGGLSCIFWTLTILTTIKYVWLVLNADNRGEGGIFALYALVRKKARWLLYPTMIGASALLADGIITPPISVSSAIEGLRLLDPEIPTIPIIILVLTLLFSVQHFGTKAVGTSFGPIMLVWFLMLSILGLNGLSHDFSVLSAINPWYAFNLIFETPGGYLTLGAVFLCTTGAEALYSDLGHCGKGNVRVSWGFVKLALLLNYFGQGAVLLNYSGDKLQKLNPFFVLMPEWFLATGILIATISTIVASQALISGSFTLVNEAIRLNFFPKLRVTYPTIIKGQVYVPAINTMLYLGCIGVVLYFQESSNMEAAYGLAITVTMITTTILLAVYLSLKEYPKLVIFSLIPFLLTIEILFFGANILKFVHGGWVALLIGAFLFFIMWLWKEGTIIKGSFKDTELFSNIAPILEKFSNDTNIPKYSTHLVFLTGERNPLHIERRTIYSILQRRPKRADVYWFLHIDVQDEPHTNEYQVTELLPGKAFRCNFRLGFRVEPRINLLFRRVVQDLKSKGRVDVLSRYPSLRDAGIPGDFCFVVHHKYLSGDNDLSDYKQFIMNGYFFLKKFSILEEENFGLDTSALVVEHVPLLIAPAKPDKLVQV
jgi:KUP system potassium uptake protein